MTPDAGTEDAGWRSGLQFPRDQVAYFPRSPEPGKAYPAIVVFNDKNQGWWDFVKGSGWKQVADENEVILLGASDPGSWLHRDLAKGRNEDAYELFIPELRLLVDELPIDRKRIFAVAHPSGARVVEQFADEPFVRGVVIHTFNRPADKHLVKHTRPIPILFIAPTGSNFWHHGDGNCTRFGKISRYEAHLRQRNSCGKVPEQRSLPGTVDGESAVCRTWSCEAHLEICHIPGGPRWPGTGPYIEDDCFSQGVFEAESEARFDSTAYAWEFLSNIVPSE